MDYTQFVPPVLAVFGGSLQWVRQYKSISDVWVALVAVVLGAAAYGLSHVFGSDWRLETLSGIIAVAGYTTNVLGGTFTASRLAAGGLSSIPMTNSK